MIENLSFSLTSPQVEFFPFSNESESSSFISVDSSKSSEHVILRASLVPSLLEALSRNIHEQYPQRFFEIGKVFERNDKKQIVEKWSLCAITAHSDADYTEVKSIAVSLLELGFGLSSVTSRSKQVSPPYYIDGRNAILNVLGKNVGSLGEIKPQALEQFHMRMPASAFEIDLSSLLQLQ